MYSPIIKDISSWNNDDIKSWLKSMNMSQYIPNFSSNQINGYDLVDLSKEDMKTLGLTNIHHINILLGAIKDLVLQQLKLNINFEGKNATIQLECDRNYTVENFVNILNDIFKPLSKIFLLTSSNEILMPNLKIAELILHNPNVYKNFKVVPSERLPTSNYSPKIGEFTSTTSYTNSYNTVRNNNYFKDNNENNDNKQNFEKVDYTSSYLKPSNSSKNVSNLGNFEKYKKTYLEIQESKITENKNNNLSNNNNLNNNNLNNNNLNNTNDILFNRYRNLGEYNSNISKSNIDINNYMSENNSSSKGKNNYYNSRNNRIPTTQQVNQRVPSLDLKTNVYNNNTHSYSNSNNITPQTQSRQNTIPNYRKNYGLQNGELSIGGKDETKNNNMEKIDYSQTVYENFKKDQKVDDNQKYVSEKRGFRGLENDNNFYSTNLNNNNYSNYSSFNNFNNYNNLNDDLKSNSNVFNMKNNNYMTFASTTPKMTERRQFDTNLKAEMRGYMTGYGDK